MVKISEEIMQIIKNYLSDLQQDINVEKAILFGSYAKGTNDKNSDIDLAIVSNHFRGKKRVDSINYLLLKAIDYNIDIEPIPFTDEEYAEKDGFIKEVLKYGIDISVN